MRDRESYSKAGKKGYQASKEKLKSKIQERRKSYEIKPNICKTCNINLPYEKRTHKFCSHSCSAKSSNKNRKHIRLCPVCSKELSHANPKFCSNRCQGEYRWQKTKQKMLDRGYDDSTQCRAAKKYIIETNGHRCSKCNLSEWLNQPIPLTLDHINGNPDDNSLINLRVICANCDRLEPTFGAKNRGNGRHWRRQRYKDGKSS